MLGVGEPVYVLTLTNTVYVRAYVSETHLAQVTPGASVTVSADSTERTYTGQVGFISPRAEFTPRTVETPELRTDLVYRLSGGAVHVTDATNAEIKSGTLTGLVGPDGAGKTTLMRMMAALMIPDSGSIRVAGHDVVTQPREIHSLTGYMPQRFGLYEDLSVRENLELYADLQGLDRRDMPCRFRVVVGRADRV